MQLDECSKKIGALREQKSVIFGHVGDRVAEGPLKERKKLMEDADFERNKPEFSTRKKG